MPPAPAYPPADIAAAIARGLRNADDFSDPVLDPGRFSRKYAGMSQDFRSGAWRHLDEGDLPQASNKAWGLVAETVKAVSAEYGGIIHKHLSITEVVRELARLLRNAGDVESARQLNRAFLTAGKLHINFYENELPDDIILDGLMQCEEFSELMFTLFWPAGAAAADGPAATAA